MDDSVFVIEHLPYQIWIKRKNKRVGWRGRLMLGLAAMPLWSAPTDVPWTEFRSPHFELVTDAGERYRPGLLFHRGIQFPPWILLYLCSSAFICG